ncbi:MAG: ABC transporter permease [Planctomycetota bacterium]|nr:ABC transporter permease [Planctomycetota bacterium]
MNFIALRMLTGDRLKYLSLVAGLAFAALLVTQQASIFSGYALRTGSWIRDTRCADLWVMNDQADFTEANKPILDTALSRVRGVSGVLWAVPMYRGYLKCRLPDGTQETIRLIGLDDATLMGGPPAMVDGQLSDLRRDRAVLINVDQAADSLMLTRATPPRPLRVGDSIAINDNEAIIAGTYRATPEFFWEPVMYTTFSRALELAPSERRTTAFVLVKVRPGDEVAKVAARIARISGLKALTGDQFEAITMDYVLKKTGILINFGMTIGLGFLIGVLVSGQTLYTFMLENLRHFAALKAMGAGNLTLIRMVCLQTLVAGGIGYGIGLGGAALTGLAFARAGLAFEMPWQIPILGAGAILLCCVLAAVFSLARVLRLEPGIVFRG